MSGHKDDRNYVITHNWLGNWEGACDQCGEEKSGSLAAVFAFLWRHKSCDGLGNDD